jgi:hypothetical protein
MQPALWLQLVIRIGFKPMTYSLEGCRSIQLSYRTDPGHLPEKQGLNGRKTTESPMTHQTFIRASFFEKKGFDSCLPFLNLTCIQLRNSGFSYTSKPVVITLHQSRHHVGLTPGLLRRIQS